MLRTHRKLSKKEMVPQYRMSPYSNRSTKIKPERSCSFHIKHKILKYTNSLDKKRKGLLSKYFQSSNKSHELFNSESRVLTETTELYDRAKSMVKSLTPDLDLNQKFLKVQEIMDELTSQNINLQKPLKLLQKAYKSIFTTLKAEEKRFRDQEHEKLSADIQRQKEIVQDMTRNVEFLAKENLKFGTVIENKDKHIEELQNTLKEISSVSFDRIPTDIETWKYIFTENKNYYTRCVYLTEKLQTKKQKEKGLLKLIDIFRDKGYPVDQIIESERKNEEKLSSDTDNERLVSCSYQPTQKHSQVPRLNI